MDWWSLVCMLYNSVTTTLSEVMGKGKKIENNTIFFSSVIQYPPKPFSVIRISSSNVLRKCYWCPTQGPTNTFIKLNRQASFVLGMWESLSLLTISCFSDMVLVDFILKSWLSVKPWNRITFCNNTQTRWLTKIIYSGALTFRQKLIICYLEYAALKDKIICFYFWLMHCCNVKTIFYLQEKLQDPL